MKFIALALLVILMATPARAANPWIDTAEIQALPMSGAAWQKVLAEANKTWPAQISHTTKSDTGTYAQALVYVRTGDQSYRKKVLTTLANLKGKENGVNALSVGRSILCYVVAADLVGFDTAAQKQAFKQWLVTGIRDKVHVGPDGPRFSLVTAHNTKPSNWGAMCGCSRIGIDIYVGDAADLAQAGQVFKAAMGDRSAWSGLKFDSDKSWQAVSSQPVQINRAGATKSGRNIDGVQPEEMRRGAKFPRIGDSGISYSFEGLQALITQAVMLERVTPAATPFEQRPFGLSNAAIARAVHWLHTPQGSWKKAYNFASFGSDDLFLVPLVNRAYKNVPGFKPYPVKADAAPGEVMAWTSWTHGQ